MVLNPSAGPVSAPLCRWALPEPYKMTSSRWECLWPNTQKQTSWGWPEGLRPLVGPVLTARHCGARLAFAIEHQNWRVRHWHPVLFTDESRFPWACERVWSSSGEQHDRFSAGSVMVWGGISMEGHTDLYRLDNGILTAIRYRDEILGPVVRPYAGAVVPPGARQCWSLVWREYAGRSWRMKQLIPLNAHLT